MRYGDFSRTKWISICSAARSSTTQPCDRSLNNFIRLGLGAVLCARSDDTDALSGYRQGSISVPAAR